MAQRWIDKANDEFYPDVAKTYQDFDLNSSDLNMLYIPVAFQIKYHKEYLKKIQVPLSLDIKYRTEIRPSKGIYKKLWYKGDNTDDKQMKSLLISGNAKVEDKNQGSGKPGEKNEKNNVINDINKELAKFFNVLFNFENEKYEITLFGVTYKNTSLWKLILERVKLHYM